jgi:hypothetical protein
MKRYRYYSIKDPNKETIGLISAFNYYQALDLACIRKRLTEDEFLNIFILETIPNEKNDI